MMSSSCKDNTNKLGIRKPKRSMGTISVQDNQYQMDTSDDDECDQSYNKKLCADPDPDLPFSKNLEGNLQNLPLPMEAEFEPESEPEQETAAFSEHPIFSIELVILEILKNLTDAQLLILRAVNLNLKFHATKMLQRRNTHKIKFKYNWTRQQYFKIALKVEDSIILSTSSFSPSSNDNVNDFTVSIFTNFLETSSNFPCNSFSFLEGTLKSSDLQHFLNKHGHLVKGLHVDILSRETTTSTSTTLNGNNIVQEPLKLELLRNLLVDQVPNLHRFHLNKCPLQWFYGTNFFQANNDEDRILLPNLKILKNDDSVPHNVYTDILKASINLEEVDPSNKVMSTLKANKFHLLKKFVCKPTTYEIELYEKITSKTLSKITSLTFAADGFSMLPQMYPRLSKILTSVLTASQSTLTKICFASQIGSLSLSHDHDKLHMPILNKVTSIKIATSLRPFMYNNTAQFSKKHFPKGFQFSKYFPNLIKISFDFHNLTRIENWKDFHENYDAVFSVKKIVFEKAKYLPSGWFREFLIIFPNVEELLIDIENFDVKDAALNGLWGFQRLKKLQFGINLVIPQNSYPAIDSAFTGFSLKTCEELLENEVKTKKDVFDVEGLRKFPSITNLQNLETLHLTFVDEFPVARVGWSPIITHVAAQFGFGMCPNLDVKLEFRVNNSHNLMTLKDALKPVFPCAI